MKKCSKCNKEALYKWRNKDVCEEHLQRGYEDDIWELESAFTQTRIELATKERLKEYQHELQKMSLQHEYVLQLATKPEPMLFAPSLT